MTEALPLDDLPPQRVNFTLGRVAADLGTVFYWSSPEDGTPIKVYLSGQNLHPAFPPIVETEDSSRVFTMMQDPAVKADEIPVSHTARNLLLAGGP